MLQEVLYTSMVDHAPFLMSSIKDFSDNVPGGSDKIYINEMAASAGGYISKSDSPSRQGIIPLCIFSAKFESDLPEKICKLQNIAYSGGDESHFHH